MCVNQNQRGLTLKRFVAQSNNQLLNELGNPQCSVLLPAMLPNNLLLLACCHHLASDSNLAAARPTC